VDSFPTDDTCNTGKHLTTRLVTGLYGMYTDPASILAQFPAPTLSVGIDKRMRP